MRRVVDRRSPIVMGFVLSLVLVGGLVSGAAAAPDTPSETDLEEIKKVIDAGGNRIFEERYAGDEVDDLDDPDVRKGMPASVVASYDYYDEHVEEEDWGTVRVYFAEILGIRIYAVNTTTDGDDGYLELFDKDGRPLASGLTDVDDPVVWDAAFGDVRAVVDD